MKIIATIVLLVVCLFSIDAIFRNQRKNALAERLRLTPDTTEIKDLVLDEPPFITVFRPPNEKWKAYQIALKELNESKVEILEIEHDHLQCLILWEQYRSSREMKKALDKMLSEGMKEITNNAVKSITKTR